MDLKHKITDGILKLYEVYSELHTLESIPYPMYIELKTKES
jgi:hypothetical protein